MNTSGAIVTKEVVASKIAAFLHHDITLAQLVDWAEDEFMDGDFEDVDTEVIADVVGRLGLADVGGFELTWEVCESFLHRLGYAARIEVIPE